ncbi:MAG: nickel-dependent lactate racemase, partial [Flexilinea sp.]|nr:nickel-dependent lactate racemase [Flexilinea sp.]
STVQLNIPDKNLLKVLEANPIQMIGDESEIVQKALQNPIQSRCLNEIVRKGEKIAIITSDITRPMPSARVLPFVLDELSSAGIPTSDIVIIFALGNHRSHTEEEKKILVGEEIYKKYECIDSNGPMVRLGITANGTPVDIFERIVKVDKRICLGNIEYHYFAGYSGGAKAIMPGVSTREAIQANHRHMTDPNAIAGKIENNPVRTDIESVLNFISVDFIVNVILDEHKKIVRCVAGDVIAAHRQGCRYLDQMYSVEIPEKADIVIVSPGGYPKDINLYQAQKALDNAKNAVRNGGSILWIASAKEGLGEKTFEEWMLHHNNPSEMIEHIQKEFVLGGHKAAAIAMVMQKATVILYSELNPELVRKIKLESTQNPQETLERLMNQYGQNASIIAMPYGGATLPILADKR